MTRIVYGKALSSGLCRQLLPRRGEMMFCMHLLCSKEHCLSWKKIHLVCMDLHVVVCVFCSLQGHALPHPLAMLTW